MRRKGGRSIQSESNDWVRKHGHEHSTGVATITGAETVTAFETQAHEIFSAGG